MVGLAPFDPADSPFRPGDRVVLRPVADWRMGGDDGERPVRCGYGGPDGAVHALSWPADLDDLAGGEVELIAPAQFDSRGLPRVRHPHPAGVTSTGRPHPDGHLTVCVHPDWLGPVSDPAGPPCCCDVVVLITSGCKCGRMARERAARCA